MIPMMKGMRRTTDQGQRPMMVPEEQQTPRQQAMGGDQMMQGMQQMGQIQETKRQQAMMDEIMDRMATREMTQNMGQNAQMMPAQRDVMPLPPGDKYA